MTDLKLKFDSTLEFQRQAIDSVVGLFAGMPPAPAQFSLIAQTASQLGLSELGVANPVADDQVPFEELVLENLRSVQEANDLPRSDALAGMNFSVEMETGTGKTYVYLRTAFELHKAYGFKKFVIVVPSIAIREGVIASIELLREHLASLYLEPFDAAVYDSRQLGRVRQFASANSIQFLVMNIQAFQKDVEEDADDRKANIINRAQDRLAGRRPIEFVQATNPVVIIDEPQNMESEAASAAIDRLSPFCTLRYSATHKNPYNRVYRLGPIDAYDLNLVKRIEVASVIPEENYNAAFVRLLKVDAAKARAQIRINHGVGSAATQKSVWVKREADLFHLSGERQEYANNFIVDDISFRSGAEAVEFSGGTDVTLAEAAGSFDEDTRRAQIAETVRQHLDKELSLAPRGVKVLSLIFIDKVANYRALSDDGAPTLGVLGQWFEESYAELAAQPRYKTLALPPVEQVHDGYFSVDNKNNYKDTRGNTEGDATTYDLIMRDKERLLSQDEPLRFIFSHSALREGWDNPNVFQICTLNESRSRDRKRQEIGRGLRLPVDQTGERIRDPHVNKLTIIANEAYDEFARALQTEYEEDTGQRFGVVPKEAFAKLVQPAAADVDEPVTLGPDASATIWEHLREAGYLDAEGVVLPLFDPHDESFLLDVPAEYGPLRSHITDAVSRFVFANRVGNARKRQTVSFKKQVTLDAGFKDLWDRISRRTKYRVSFSSDDLVDAAIADIAKADAIGPPRIRVRTVEIEHSAAGIAAGPMIDQRDYETARPTMLPDILADLQNETDLTRATLVRILVGSKRLHEFALNPQAYLELVTTTINRAMRKQMVDGLTYEPIPGLAWEMQRLEPDVGAVIERYVHRLYKVKNDAKSPFDHIEFESDVERRFAESLDANRHVRFFIKLPPWFTVDTPLGPYNPDWAIVFDGKSRVYLVRETKSTLEDEKRRTEENVKIDCARRHFTAIDVDYDVTTSVEEMISKLQAAGR